MASIASTGAADARRACGSRPSPPHRASPSSRHQEAGLPDAAAVEAMLAIALLRLQKNEPHPFCFFKIRCQFSWPMFDQAHTRALVAGNCALWLPGLLVADRRFYAQAEYSRGFQE